MGGAGRAPPHYAIPGMSTTFSLASSQAGRPPMHVLGVKTFLSKQVFVRRGSLASTVHTPSIRTYRVCPHASSSPVGCRT